MVKSGKLPKCPLNLSSVERVGGKMIQLSSSAMLLLIILAVLILLLGISLLAAHIVEIRDFGGKDF